MHKPESIIPRTTKERSVNTAPRRKQGLVRTVAAGVGLLLSAGCLENPPVEWSGSVETTRLTVGVEGDSLTHSAHRGQGAEANGTNLTDLLNTKGYKAGVAATIGATTADLKNRNPWPEPGVDILVTALGTNDGHLDAGGIPAVDIETYATNIRTHIADVAPDCWVGVGVRLEPSWGLDQTGPSMNDALRAIAEESGGVYVDWNTVVQASETPLLGSDRIHFNWPDTTGAAAYRSLIAEGVDQCAAQLGEQSTSAPEA